MSRGVCPYFVEAGMGMEGRIMCVERCTPMSSVVFLGPQNSSKSLVDGALSHTPLDEFTAFPRPPTVFNGAYSKARTSK